MGITRYTYERTYRGSPSQCFRAAVFGFGRFGVDLLERAELTRAIVERDAYAALEHASLVESLPPLRDPPDYVAVVVDGSESRAFGEVVEQITRLAGTGERTVAVAVEPAQSSSRAWFDAGCERIERHACLVVVPRDDALARALPFDLLAEGATGTHELAAAAALAPLWECRSSERLRWGPGHAPPYLPRTGRGYVAIGRGEGPHAVEDALASAVDGVCARSLADFGTAYVTGFAGLLPCPRAVERTRALLDPVLVDDASVGCWVHAGAMPRSDEAVVVVRATEGALDPSDRAVVGEHAPLRILDCHVAGTSFRDLARIAPCLAAGDRLSLVREPGNVHDARAVRVLDTQGVLLGYLPRALNEVVARLLDAGVVVFATLEATRWHDTWLRIDIGVWLSR